MTMIWISAEIGWLSCAIIAWMLAGIKIRSSRPISVIVWHLRQHMSGPSQSSKPAFLRHISPWLAHPMSLLTKSNVIQTWVFSHFMLRFADYPKTEGVKLFINEVLPRFK